jgi:cytochrome c peroxidase
MTSLHSLPTASPWAAHNGSAATLMDVVNFYDQRFNLNLTEGQKSDLVAFLRSL